MAIEITGNFKKSIHRGLFDNERILRLIALIVVFYIDAISENSDNYQLYDCSFSAFVVANT